MDKSNIIKYFKIKLFFFLLNFFFLSAKLSESLKILVGLYLKYFVVVVGTLPQIHKIWEICKIWEIHKIRKIQELHFVCILKIYACTNAQEF